MPNRSLKRLLGCGLTNLAKIFPGFAVDGRRNWADPWKLFVPEGEVLEQVETALRSIQIPEALLDTLLAHLRASHEAENQFHKDAIAGLRREYDQTRERLDTLLDMRIGKSITQDEYDRKARELKERQAEI